MIFLEELREASRQDRGSSEESSESAQGREPTAGGNEVARPDCLDSLEEDLREDNPQGSVEDNPNFQAIAAHPDTQGTQGVHPPEGVQTNKDNTLQSVERKRTWQERDNIFSRTWREITVAGMSPNEESMKYLGECLKDQEWGDWGDSENNDVNDFMQEWARILVEWKLSPRAVETLLRAIGKGKDSRNKNRMILLDMARKVRKAYHTNQASNKTKAAEVQGTMTENEKARIEKLNEELRTVNELPNMTVLEETWEKIRKLTPGETLRDQSTDPKEIWRIRGSLMEAITKMTPAALTILDSMANQRPPESVATNKKLLGLYEEIGKRAGAAHQTLRGDLSKRGMEADKTGAINKVMEFVCALAVGDVIMKTTAEAAVHPSPTARIHALMANRTGKKTWSEITKSEEMAATNNQHLPDANTMLRKASMCLLYKVEGTKSPKWRATVQLMNWVANSIPILAIPLLLDIFPHMDAQTRDRKGYASLLNTATAKQWNDKETGDREMVKILKCSQDEWESGKNTPGEKLRLLTQHSLTEYVRQFNALTLLWAVTALCHGDTMMTGLKNREGNAKRAAKEALRNSFIPGAFHFLNTSEMEYNEPRMEAAIQRSREKGKLRLAQLLLETHNATKRGSSKGISEVFGDKGTKCPDCEKEGEVKILILNPSDPAQGIYEHLGHCGESGGKKKHRLETPQPNTGTGKRNRQEATEMERPMTALPVKGRGTCSKNNRGFPFGRRGFHSNSPANNQPMNQKRFQDNVSGMDTSRNQGGFQGSISGYGQHRNQGEFQFMDQTQPHQGYFSPYNNTNWGTTFRNQNDQRVDYWNNQNMPNQQDM